MANKRVFYAAKAVGVGPVGSAGGHLTGTTGGKFQQLHGIQSVGITTTFNLEQTFELGQLAIYENIEGIPDVSIDIEKVLDGYAPVYVLATSVNGDGSSSGANGLATAATLIGRSKAQCDFVMAIYKDTDELGYNADEGAATGGGTHMQPQSHVVCSGVFVNSVSYNVGIDGYATESVTLIGQDKIWYSLEATPNFKRGVWAATDRISSLDEPKSLTQGSGGVNRREDVLFEYPSCPRVTAGQHVWTNRDVNGAQSGLGTVLPIELPGISASGTNDKASDGNFGCHVQSFNCSTDFGREDIFELGRRGRYHRFVNFPTEATTEISVISTSGDLISATEEGVVDAANGANLNHQTIRLHLREGLIVDLGKKNKLASVSVTGGDAGGGNEEITYSYTNFNDFAVYHPQDPNHKKASDGASYITSEFTPRDGRGEAAAAGKGHRAKI